MTRYSSLVTLAMLIAAIPCEASDADPVAPMLRLEEAIELALGNNHLLASTALEISAAEEHVKALRTYRLPVLQIDAQGVRMTDSLDFTIPAGSLGSIQAQDATITIPADYGGWATFSVSQPITQQYRIGLGVDHARLDREIAAEERRWEVQRLVAEIRSTYYRISALEAGVLALRDLVTAVEELDAVTSRYLEEGLVLRSDALDVRARLARERQRLASAENGLETQREHLNQLLGRDVTTEFRVAPPYE
ncbi:MAG: TolC family protein, partial [Acidobacteria bacterium]|nr:TolC family protein [Acidobacteriota bacterium]